MVVSSVRSIGGEALRVKFSGTLDSQRENEVFEIFNYLKFGILIGTHANNIIRMLQIKTLRLCLRIMYYSSTCGVID